MVATSKVSVLTRKRWKIKSVGKIKAPKPRLTTLSSRCRRPRRCLEDDDDKTPRALLNWNALPARSAEVKPGFVF